MTGKIQKRSLRLFLPLLLVLAILASFIGLAVPASAVDANTVIVEGASPAQKATTVNTISIPHTTGTGTDRLMLVGISWNCGTTDRTISTTTPPKFTPTGGSAINLTEAKTQQYTWTTTTGSPPTTTTNYRYAAIYKLVNPPSGVSGTVTVTFSGAVSNGIVADAVNFANVNQNNPLGTPNGAGGSSADTPPHTNPSVSLTGLTGNELVFDTVFIGHSASGHTLAADSGQSEQWNIADLSGSYKVRGAASTKQASSAGSLTMSWTPGGYGSTAIRWAIAAVPINPAPARTAHITVVKNVLSEGGSFDFTGSGVYGLPATFTIAPTTPTTFDGAAGFTGSQTFDVAPGAYTVTESPVPEGWMLYSSMDKDGVETLGDASVDVTLADLETATIYFYNHKNVGPIWPVPELAAGILLALGLAGIGGFIVIRRKRARSIR
jgi:hypothetical protein